MSTLETGTIEPQSGTTVTLGTSGDAVVIGADALKVNTIKDAGANTILTSNGSGTLSSVNSGLGGGMVFISSATASNSSSLSFTSGIDSTYDEYVFYFVNINPVTDDVQFEFNASDDTSGWVYNILKTTTVFTAWHAAADDTDGLSYQAGYDLAESADYQRIMASLSNDADEAGSGILHLFAPSSAYVKNFYLRTESNHYEGRETDCFVAGYFNTTAAITALDFKMSSGNINEGTIYLYGIK